MAAWLSLSPSTGTDPDMAQIRVQNQRVSRALPRLPEEVQRIGVGNGENVTRYVDGGPSCRRKNAMTRFACLTSPSAEFA